MKKGSIAYVQYNNKSRKGTYIKLMDKEGYTHIVATSQIPISELENYYNKPKQERSRKIFNDLKRFYELNKGSSIAFFTPKKNPTDVTSASESNQERRTSSKIISSPKQKLTSQRNKTTRSSSTPTLLQGVHSIEYSPAELAATEKKLTSKLISKATNTKNIKYPEQQFKKMNIHSRMDHTINLYGMNTDSKKTELLAQIFVHGKTIKEFKERYHLPLIGLLQNKESFDALYAGQLQQQFRDAQIKPFVHRGIIQNATITTRIRN